MWAHTYLVQSLNLLFGTTHALGLSEELVLEHRLRPQVGEHLPVVVLARHAPAVLVQDEDCLHLREQFLRAVKKGCSVCPRVVSNLAVAIFYWPIERGGEATRFGSNRLDGVCAYTIVLVPSSQVPESYSEVLVDTQSYK